MRHTAKHGIIRRFYGRIPPRMTDATFADKETRLELFAGIHPVNQQPVFEQCLATPCDKEGEYRLLKSPLFVRGVAALDRIALNPDARGRFQVVERSGNLCLRVFLREANSALEEQLTAEVEKLGGSLDVSNERALVYSLYFGVGFLTVEKLFDKLIARGEAKWLYGNVYDDQGEPLNWWQDMVNA